MDKQLPPQKLHSKGLKLREQDKHLDALAYLDQALIGYQKEGNCHGVIGVLGDRSLVWKHLFLTTNDNVYRILAKNDAEAMLIVCKDRNVKEDLGAAYFTLGEVTMLFEDYKMAIINYKNAIKFYSGTLANKGNYLRHLGEAQYKNGEKELGVETILAGIDKIEKGSFEVESFVYHVWLSGAFGKIAELLKEDDSQKAKKYLREAKEIVDKDPRLIIRKRQIEKLTKVINKL